MMHGLTPQQKAEVEDLVDEFGRRMIEASFGDAGAACAAFLAELDTLATPAARAVAQHIRTAPARRAARLTRP